MDNAVFEPVEPYLGDDRRRRVRGMFRACKLTLKYVTAKKRRAIKAFLEAYRAAVNFYIKSIWVEKGRLDNKTLFRLKSTRLSKKAQASALRQAIGIVVSARNASKSLKRRGGIPFFTGGAVLYSGVADIQLGKKSFDVIIRLSTLDRGNRISIPTKRTAVLKGVSDLRRQCRCLGRNTNPP